MQERIVGGALGAARLVLVVAAMLVALVPIGRSAVSGFCPDEVTTEAAGQVVLAAAAGDAWAQAPASDADASASEAPVDDQDASLDDPLDAPVDDPDASVEDLDPDAPADEGDTEDDPCGGVDRCLPPLISASLNVSSAACGEQAVDRLQASMGRAFLLASVMLGAAWALRPRDDEPILSRH